MSVLRLTEEQFAAAQKRARKPATRAQTAPPSPTHTKYRNRPTGGYASVKEARRAEALKLLLAAGEIRGLREQVKFELIPRQDGNGKMIERPCSYVADFVYAEPTDVLNKLFGPLPGVFAGTREWIEVVEDCKGMRTPDYIIKRKLMLHVHGICIRET